MTYEHTQARSLLPVALVIIAVATACVAILIDALYLLATPAVLLLCSVVVHAFSSLTTVVTPDTVRVCFRWGRPKRTIARTRIVEVEIVRNKWWYGWGLRFIPGATMYNVWGLDAVHLRLADDRDFRIGTDDPHGLAAALDGDQAAAT